MGVTKSDLTDDAAGKLIDEVELEIGGQLIDRHCGKWMDIWVELTHSMSKKQQYDHITAKANINWLPLQFSFCRNPGLAIPLIALQYHEVKLNFRFNTIDDDVSVCLYCDYIYLDTDERRRFAQTSHEYLIEQTQSSKSNVVAKGCVTKFIHFNHPVKELVGLKSWR